MSKQKIILTVTTDLNFDQRMQRICLALHQHGFEVLLVGRKRANSPKLLEQPYQQKRLGGFFKRGFLFYAEYNIRLFFFLLFAKFDVVCGIDMDTLTAAYYASKLKSKPCVYDAHEYFSESPELEGRTKVKRFWQRLENRLIPKVDAIYTVSEGIADIFQHKYKRQIGLVRNMPFYSELETTTEKGNYVLYQGALNVGRGLEALISIADKIKMPIYLAGEGDLSAQLRALAKSKGEQVKFLGRVEPKQLKAITQQATLGVNLLEPMGESYRLSLSNKFFDYVMAGIPQVCIAFPSYVALNATHEVAVLVDDLEINHLTQTINNLIEDHNLQQRLISNCKQAREAWNWEKEQQTLIEIYKQFE